MIGIFIDIFLVLLVIAFTYFGYKKGLIEVAFKILSFFIAIIISIVLFKPVSYCIINFTPIDEHIHSYVYNTVSNHIDNKTPEKSNLPASFAHYIDKTIEETSKTIKDNVATAVSNSITSTVVNILAFLIVFIISRFILIFVHLLSDTLAELPIVQEFNDVGGLLYGFLKATIIVFVTLAILSILPFENIKDIINGSYITLFLYNINPILWILL